MPNLPDIHDSFENSSAEARQALGGAIMQAIKELREKDVQQVSLGQLLVMVGYDAKDVPPEDFEVEINLAQSDFARFQQIFMRSILTARPN